MATFRRLTSGIMFVPRRGVPPLAPAGYEHDPGDPYVYLQILDPCDERVAELRKSSCCGQKTILYCNQYKKHIVRSECVACQGEIPFVILEGK